MDENKNLKVVRVVRQDKDYVMIYKHIYKNKELSLKAMGLYTLLIAMSDTTEISILNLQTMVKDKQGSIETAMKELISAGYVTKELIRNARGVITGTCWTVYETPELKELKGSEKKKAPQPETKPVTKTTADAPLPGQMTMAELGQNIPAAEIEDNLKPRKTTKTTNKTAEYEAEFEEIWKGYIKGKKDGKKDARKAYVRARRRGITADTIAAAVDAYRRYVNDNDIDLKYVKNGSNWFTEERWDDERIVPYLIDKERGKENGKGNAENGTDRDYDIAGFYDYEDAGRDTADYSFDGYFN